VTDAQAFLLAGKHAVLAGVGGPLARAAAVALAEGGATVSLLTQADERSQEVEAQSILNECWSLGQDGEVLRVDSAAEPAVNSALDQLEARVGPVAVLVTVPQAARGGPAAEATRQTWRAEIARSATPIVIPVLAAGRRMLARGEGRIVNVVDSSYDGHEAGTALFAAAQGAVLAFTRALDVEWAAQGIHVRSLIAQGVDAGTGPHAHAAFREALRRCVVDADAPAAEAAAGSTAP
jgi:NAD(P)-dependent dehydrogenase (short-subunit alcohol dehydrogenase family)